MIPQYVYKLKDLFQYEADPLYEKIPILTIPDGPVGNPYLNNFPKEVELPCNYTEEQFQLWCEAHTKQWKYRELATKMYAWAIPSPEAIEVIRQYLPGGICEIGAGSGYWARMVTEKFDDERYTAYDNFSSHAFTHRWYNVTDKIKPQETMFICWPTYDDTWAYNVIRLFKPKRIIYIGEGYGGCTADDAFHDQLKALYDQKEILRIPQFHTINDRLEVWE